MLEFEMWITQQYKLSKDIVDFSKGFLPKLNFKVFIANFLIKEAS